MNPIPLPMRRFGLTAVLVVIGLAIYTGWWFSLANHAEDYFRAWQAGLAGQGATATARMSVSGYPFAVTLHARDFAYEKPGLIKISSPDLMVRMRPWTPFRPTALANDDTIFEFQKAGYTVKTGRFEIVFVRPWIGPYSAHDTGLVIGAHFYDVKLDEKKPMALGNDIQELSFTSKVRGFPPDIFKAASLAAWRDAGSVVDIQWLTVQWGPLMFDGSGTMALDKALQPQAAFNGKVAGYDKAIDALRDAGQVKPLVASLFKAALKLLENQKRHEGEEPTVSVPITVQNNSLAAAGVILARWEPFPWP